MTPFLGYNRGIEGSLIAQSNIAKIDVEMTQKFALQVKRGVSLIIIKLNAFFQPNEGRSKHSAEKLQYSHNFGFYCMFKRYLSGFSILSAKI